MPPNLKKFECGLRMLLEMDFPEILAVLIAHQAIGDQECHELQELGIPDPKRLLGYRVIPLCLSSGMWHALAMKDWVHFIMLPTSNGNGTLQ